MAEETAYAAHQRKQAAADDCLTVLLDGIRAFFDGKASLHISATLPGNGTAIRFYKDQSPSAPNG